ncbi:MAG: DUF393 domain-containing protein [Chloroflexi bacterium]|nr:DUF393 domain-containing protein [Chloroflexota bacterium]
MGQASKGEHGPLVLIYDDDCGFCTWQSRLAQRLVGAERLRLQPLDDPIVLVRYPQLEAAAIQRRLHVVDPASGAVQVGGDAVRHLLAARWFLRPLAWLLGLPGVRALLNWAYDLVAGRRQALSRILGLSVGRCPVPHSRRSNEGSR